MSFNVTPSAGQLRELLPEVASRMEEEFVISQLRKLGIVFAKRRIKGELVIGIPLTPDHFMAIRAVDVGPGERKEFVTFVRVPKMRLGQRVKESSLKETIRAHVKISTTNEDDSFAAFSYTLHEENMENIIRAAIEGTYQTRNLMLKPLMKKGIKRSKRPSSLEGNPGGFDE